MKNIIKGPKIVILLILFPFLIQAQDSISSGTIFPKSISLSYGYGRYAVKDEFFSKEKYDGGMPLIDIEWMSMRAKYGERIGLEFRNSSDISNYTMKANVVQFLLYHDFLYPVGDFKLFSKDVYTYLGPSLELSFYYNQQKFAESGIYFDFSFTSLVSFGADLYLISQINHSLQVESNLRTALISIGIRMPEISTDDDGASGDPIKLTTPLTGSNINFDLGVRYYIVQKFSVKLAYKFDLFHVAILKPATSVSNNLVGTLSLHF